MALDYSIIGQRLKRARKNLRMTQAELAEKLNISIAYVSRIERGSSKISLTRLTDFCSALEVSEGEILNGVSNSNSNYLSDEFNDIFNKCSPKKQQLIYKLSKLIAEDSELYF